MTKDTTKIALIQMRCGTAPEKNFARAIEFIRDAARQGAAIVCLPELFRSQYFCQTEDHKNFDLAEEVPGKSTAALGEVAKETATVIIASLFERRSAGVYHNTAAIIGADGKLLGKYRKMHIPDDPLYHEKFYFAPGDLGFRAWDTARGKIGVCVCWDQWYPEAARLTALRGAEIIFYPTAIGWFKELKRDEPFSAQRWEDAMRAHASLNGIFTAAVNRVGREGDLRFWGGSFVADPFGEVVARASHSKEEVLVAKLDLTRIRQSQEGWRFLHNRRPRSYTDLVR